MSCAPVNGKKVAIHELGDYALAKLVLAPRGDAAAARRASEALRCLFSYQRLGPKEEENHGVFPFHTGDPTNPRDNPTEFALAPVAAISAFGLLPSADLAAWDAGVKAGLAAIDAHHVCPGYTNICLMQAGEMLAIGAALARRGVDEGPSFVARGLARLEEWTAYTRENGIHEFDSPTYTEVDLESLLLAYHAGAGDLARRRAHAALDHVWAHVAASWFAGRDTVAGPASRTYDFLTGGGALSTSLYLEGLRAGPPSPAPDVSRAILLADHLAGGYRPSGKSLCLSALPAREVLSRHGPPGTGRDRTLYLTPDFAIGSASDDYNPKNLGSDQDQLLRADLASSPETPVISVLPDYLDAPGSSVQAGDFQKVTHLLMAPAAAQKAGAVLALLRVPAKDPAYRDVHGAPLGLVNLSTNVIFPADADEVRVDGALAPRSRDREVGPRPTLVVRIRTGAVAVGVLSASGLECAREDGSVEERGAATIRLRPLHGATAGRGASARLAVYHATTLPEDRAELAPCFARVALLMVGERCEGEACAQDLGARVAAASRAAVQTWDPRRGDWDVRVRAPNGADLHVRRTVGRRERVVAREVDGASVVFPPLSVNGTPVVLAGE
jgi:hypothetical protein